MIHPTTLRPHAFHSGLFNYAEDQPGYRSKKIFISPESSPTLNPVMMRDPTYES